MPLDLDTRFWSKVQITDGDSCWEWTAAQFADGYGSFRLDGTHVLAHRMAFRLHYGYPIPDGLFVCHHCDNRLCCRPDHWFLGTPQDNMSDMKAKGRGRRPRNDDRTVRALREAGLSQQAIADIVGVTQTSISISLKRYRPYLPRLPAVR